jgi:hypothetical protein
MLYVIEIERPPDTMTKIMGEIREWLDAHRVEPDACRFSTDSGSITFRLEFSREAEAVACMEGFGGRLLPIGE